METIDSAADVVDRLWRAYAPYQRGRDTSGDLASMLAILALARHLDSLPWPSDPGARWERAVAEAGVGSSPLADLRAIARIVGRDPGFPVPGIADIGFLGDDEVSDDVPWAAAYLVALSRCPRADVDWGLVCELLLERRVQESTFSPGEYYTPREVAQLMTMLAEPWRGERILDPACGSGGLLAAVARRIGWMASERDDTATFEAYATDRSNVWLATMNLALHGVDQPVVRASDPVSLLRDQSDGRADVVLSNPPFNQRAKGTAGVRWPFGPPPESNANFAWLQLVWSRLSASGRAVVVMPPHAATSSNSREAAIRTEMVGQGTVRAIIALPPRLFPRTSTSAHLWVLAHATAGRVPKGDAGSVLFIDASGLGRAGHRQQWMLTDDDIDRISDCFWTRGSGCDEPGFARLASHDEIVRHGFNLDVRLYVRPDREQPAAVADARRVLEEADAGDDALATSGAELRWSFEVCDRLVRYGADAPRLPLDVIVKGVPRGAFGESAAGLLLAGPSGSLIRADDYVDDGPGLGGVPVVMPKDLAGDGFSTASIKCIADEHAERLERFRLRPGDIVLARRGELGRCAVVREEQNGWICGTGCFVIRLPADVDADYLAAYLGGAEARAWLEEHSTNSMAMKTISLTVLGALPVPMPDLPTQEAIATLMRRLERHEQLLREQGELMRTLKYEAMHGFLSGG